MSPDAPLAGTTVLLTEDEPGVRRLLGIVFARAGCTVLEAGTGREAVDAVREHGEGIDAVLLDVTMPVMSGPEAFAHIRDEQPGIPVVFFSGYDRNEVAEQLRSPTSYTSFVPKPCANDELIAEIRRAIESRR